MQTVVEEQCAGADANAVSIKAPQFAESSASAWFVIMDAQFNNCSITVSSTKFYHSLANLPPQIIQRLSADVLKSESFEELQKAVLELVETSKPQLFDNLMDDFSLHGKPSEGLAKIQKTAEKVGVTEEFVRHRFIKSMPANFAPTLAAQKTMSLSELGKLADDLQTYASSDIITTSNAVKTSMNNSSLEPFFPNQKPKVCRAHIFYGKQATSCRNWCEFPDKPNSFKRGSSPNYSNKRSVSPNARHSVLSTSTNSITVAFVMKNKIIQFLVDTGSGVTILPLKMVNKWDLRTPDVQTRLTAADGRQIKVHGEVFEKLMDPQSKTVYETSILVADVSRPIIGCDFLIQNNILIDCKKKLLHNKSSNNKITCFGTNLARQIPKEVEQILQKYSNVLQQMSEGVNLKSEVRHLINTKECRPIFCKSRQLTP